MKCEDCPFLYDDCDGEDSVHICHFKDNYAKKFNREAEKLARQTKSVVE